MQHVYTILFILLLSFLWKSVYCFTLGEHVIQLKLMLRAVIIVAFLFLFPFLQRKYLNFQCKMSVEDLSMFWKHIISLNFTDKPAISNISLGLKLKRRRTICPWVSMRWGKLETHNYSSADGHPLHKVCHFHRENSSKTHFEGAQLESERDWCKTGWDWVWDVRKSADPAKKK